MVAGGSNSRLPVLMSDLALCSSDDDFAGTKVVSMASAAPQRFVPLIEWPDVVEPVAAQPISLKAAGRATPPELLAWENTTRRVSGLGHRWWIPGLAGVAATMMFVGVLFTITAGPAPATGLIEIPNPEPLKPLRVIEISPITAEDEPAVASTSRPAR